MRTRATAQTYPLTRSDRRRIIGPVSNSAEIRRLGLLPLTLRDVITRLDEFEDDATIYVERSDPAARAVVAIELEDGGVPPEASGLVYFLEVQLAREAIDVLRARLGRTPMADEKVAAVTYYAQNDAWLPTE